MLSVVHNPALLPLLADRVIGLRQGRIVFDLPITEVDDGRLLTLYRAEAEDIMPRIADQPAARNLAVESA